MQILLIEDDLSLAQGLMRSLRHDRFTVNHLSLGRQAINSIKTTPPDMVILDLGLPDMDGTDVLAEIRKHNATVPILVLTA
ncbi:response regulator, partial [Methylophaga sp. UBA3191]